MEPIQSLGKMVLLMGVLLLVIGGLMMGFGKIFNFGKLPGDIHMQKGNLTVYFPIGTMIVISLLLTILANLFFRR
ncbi:DUF2905 domain-containing protein [Desulfofalx alkaliphila]|uniref:DUF2905 domain-containing protein n=1 Tax=Desulfofalx alkaliphila TaxID=105483 RepID=UPI0004E27CE0|nr:DUF2905 domain-containing protein [Desulfofalx alkaliphila]